ALFDSVVLAARRLMTEQGSGRVIVLLTDGRDVSSAASLDDAVDAAHHARASVYPIGIAGPDYTPAPLRALAERTGGIYHEAASSKQVASIYATIGRTLSHTWVLRYPTSARPGEDVKLTASIPRVGTSDRVVLLSGTAAPETA